MLFDINNIAEGSSTSLLKIVHIILRSFILNWPVFVPIVYYWCLESASFSVSRQKNTTTWRLEA